ncbi:hypothetical protein [Rhizobium sp. 62_C5_N11_2]
MELDTADHRRSSGVTSGLHRMLTVRMIDGVANSETSLLLSSV